MIVELRQQKRIERDARSVIRRSVIPNSFPLMQTQKLASLALVSSAVWEKLRLVSERAGGATRQRRPAAPSAAACDICQSLVVHVVSVTWNGMEESLICLPAKCNVPPLDPADKPAAHTRHWARS